MKYSVIITAYNVAEYIEECIDSICTQQGDYEVLLGIDDCQETLAKVSLFMHKYPQLKVFMNDTNVGTYITRNTLFEKSKGKYIIQFDGDDIMVSDFFKTADRFLKYQVVKFLGQNFRGKENIGKPKEMCSPGIYHRSVFERFGGYKDWRIVADTEFNHRIKPFTTKIIIPKVMMRRRLHPMQLTALNPERQGLRQQEKEKIVKNPTAIEKITPKTTSCYQVQLYQ